MVINNVQSQSLPACNARLAIQPWWIAAGAAAYAAVCAVMLAVLPNGMYWQSLVALLVMGGVAAGVYSRMSWQSPGGWAVLGLAATVAATLISVNWYYFANVSGTGLDNPGLLYDPARSWRGALYMAGYDVERVDNMFLGYVSVVWACIEMFGRSVIAPMVVNGTAMLLGGIFTGSLAARLIPSRRGAAYAGMWGMIMIFAVSAFTYTSALMNKDALLCLGVPAFARALADIHRPKWIAVAVVSAMIVIWLRTSMAAMLLLVVIMMCPCFRWRRDLRGIIAAVAAIAGMYMLERSIAMGIAVQNMGAANIDLMIDYHKGSNQDVWLSFLNRHGGGWHIWQQLIVFPAGMLVQFLIPFPWDLSGDGWIMGYASAYYRFAFPWYLIGGLILYYIVKGWRNSTRPLKLLFAWAAICWMTPAYMLGGTVSRYGTPFAPVLVLGAVYVVLNLRRRKSLRRWMWIFCALMATGLTACFLIMKNYGTNI